MLCLGIECTAHTLGIGIVETGGKKTGMAHGKKAAASRASDSGIGSMHGRKGNVDAGQLAVLANISKLGLAPARLEKSPAVLANEKDMYIPKNEGIVPRKAADHHAEVFDDVMQRALSKSGCSLSDIDLFSYSMGPGLGPCLRTGAAAAKYLALLHKKPLLGINHCHAHMEVSRGMLGMQDPLVLYVSGGNTQIIIENRIINKKKSPRFRVLGETLDIGMGNLFDSFARELGMEHAHGSQVAKLAAAGKNYVPLPYTVKGMNFAFSGLFTAASKQIGRHPKEDLCFSLMETAFAEACEATERALCLTGKRELLVCGGVAQNARLCEMLLMVAGDNGTRFGAAPNEFNADNGGMIAYTALREYARGVRMKLKDCRIDQKWRIDEVF